MSKIPGFRSNTRWKKIVAIIGYLVIIAIIYSAITGNTNSSSTTAPPKQGASTSTPTTSPTKQSPTKSQAPTAPATPALTAKSLGAGTFTIGQQITPGRYTVTTPSGSGNFVVSDQSGMPVVNEVLGDSGVSKVVAALPDGGKIEISSLNKVDFNPYQPPSIGNSPTKTDLCAGSFIVGTDIPQGRYVASVIGSGSGNFVIEDQSGMPKTNEILGGDMGVKNVTVDLSNSDTIQISSLNDVQFVPSN
ncbi:hypothetical protein DEAC_c39930 [Desulfosporosinus acididurans]|uniref:Uncharacterized protein n=1 Tax=Desulfosporosinus acididurans TaxID=476652 RepID=A0A0J1FKI7_9FIRM|nr:hypothetical protein [Desulfosporosinus acididurans]KLU63999.1 hypothetical protein DEAC_c39930 [Desulfosporosinus acididurans]